MADKVLLAKAQAWFECQLRGNESDTPTVGFGSGAEVVVLLLYRHADREAPPVRVQYRGSAQVLTG